MEEIIHKCPKCGETGDLGIEEYHYTCGGNDYYCTYECYKCGYIQVEEAFIEGGKQNDAP